MTFFHLSGKFVILLIEFLVLDRKKLSQVRFEVIVITDIFTI